MATKRDLLKEAIADAKAVKETAIANAKAALEEAFTPQLKSMFAAKLREMEEEDLDEAQDEMYEAEDEMYEGKEEDMMEVDLEELLAELNEEEDEMEEGLYEAEEGDEEEESEEAEEEGEPLDLEDMTDEDLKQMIEDVIADMISSGELEAGQEGGEEEEGEEMEMSDEEEVDLAELLREMEDMDEEMYEEEVEEGLLGKIGTALGDIFGGGSEARKAAEISKEILDNNKDLVNKWVEGKDKQALMDLKRLAYNAFAKAKIQDPRGYLEDFSRELVGDPRSFMQKVAAGSGGSININREGMEKELDEAYSTIEALKNELNEINLLNAKLLYSNKIFKSKNLNESQKVKVLSSFDKATTVGEVKMVFETLNEGIKVNKNTIKENLGRASKSTVTPTAKKPIVESNDAFLRMQKLAGLI
jgi:hypothetical protein